MTDRGAAAHPGVIRLLWEMASGQRPIERSGAWLRAFQLMPPPVRDALRWVLRPGERLLYGRLRALSGDRVMSGPFAGMQLVGRPAAPELIGTYEHELASLMPALAAGPYQTVVNVGARYGYYAIGLALLNPRLVVRAFEGEMEAHATFDAAVRANGVGGRVTVGGFADVPVFREALGAGEGVLVVCDIEGGELALLDPEQVPALSRAAILVECHGPPETPTEPVMVARFLPTHEVRRIGIEERELAHLPAGVGEPWRSRMPATLTRLMQERRTPPQSWLLLTPRRS